MDSIYDLRSKRRLFVDKDVRLSDSVRNQPTAATPPQPLPQPPRDKEPEGLAEVRTRFYELNDRVAKLYDDDKDKTIAKWLLPKFVVLPQGPRCNAIFNSQTSI